ncbi:MAG: succinate--CoA ligase subunit alpha, partial [Candidatus Ranarchaeia archaeon]
MPILIDDKTKIIVQGITGHHGSYHALQMKNYGTHITSGVTPGKGGQRIHGIPVHNTVHSALQETDANASIIFVPAPYAKDAVLEAIDAELSPIVIITEHIPIKDEILLINLAARKSLDIIGPNTPGLISPGLSKVGIMPAHVFSPGPIGLVSRSGTLTYEVASALTQVKFGQSTAIGIGGDPIVGVGFVQALKHFEEDSKTKAIVLIGEIGGRAEEEAARYIAKHVSKPVIGFVAGATAPPGKRMGHAGAIISGGEGTWIAKTKALKKAGVEISSTP